MDSQELHLGMVIHFHDYACKPDPKPKFCIIVGLTEDKSEMFTVYINSEINFHIINSPELEKLQYKLEHPQSSIPFLKQTSLVDCAKPIFRLSSEFIRNFNKSQIQEIGRLKEPHLSIILTLLGNSETLSPHYKKKFKLL